MGIPFKKVALMRSRIAAVPDAQLLESLEQLVVRGRGVTVELLVHFAEVERRQLHLAAAYPTMHAYATGHLHFSNSQADNCMLGGSTRREPRARSRRSSTWSPTGGCT